MECESYVPPSLRHKSSNVIKDMPFQEEDLKEESPLHSVTVQAFKGLTQLKKFRFNVKSNWSPGKFGSKYSCYCDNLVEACYHYESTLLVALQPALLEELLKIGNYYELKEITLGGVCSSANSVTLLTKDNNTAVVSDSEDEKSNIKVASAMNCETTPNINVDPSLCFYFFTNPWQYFLELGSWILFYYDDAQTDLETLMNPTDEMLLQSPTYLKKLREAEEDITFQKMFVQVSLVLLHHTHIHLVNFPFFC
jgi:hypothetical protein